MTDLIESLTPATNPSESPCASGALHAFEELGNNGESVASDCDVDEASFEREQCHCDSGSPEDGPEYVFVCEMHRGEW